MLNMMPLSRHMLSLQTGLPRWFILGTIIPPTLAPLPSRRSSPQPLSSSTSLHERKTSTLSYLSPSSAPTSLMRLQNAHNLHNLVPSWLMTKRNTKLRKSWTPCPGGVNYGTWLSSSGGHNMWLPHAEVHAPATVEEFHLQHPNAPHTSSTSTPTTSCCL